MGTEAQRVIVFDTYSVENWDRLAEDLRAFCNATGSIAILTEPPALGGSPIAVVRMPETKIGTSEDEAAFEPLTRLVTNTLPGHQLDHHVLVLEFNTYGRRTLEPDAAPCPTCASQACAWRREPEERCPHDRTTEERVDVDALVSLLDEHVLPLGTLDLDRSWGSRGLSLRDRLEHALGRAAKESPAAGFRREYQCESPPEPPRVGAVYRFADGALACVRRVEEGGFIRADVFAPRDWKTESREFDSAAWRKQGPGLVSETSGTVAP